MKFEKRISGDSIVYFLVAQDEHDFYIGTNACGIWLNGATPVMQNQVEFYDLFKTIQEAFLESERLRKES